MPRQGYEQTDEHRIAKTLQSFREVDPRKWPNMVAVKWQKVAVIEAADTNGNVQCVSCGAVIHHTKANGGHWISRTFLQTIFVGDDGGVSNCNPQCPGCNSPHKSHGAIGLAPIMYTMWMLDRHGRCGCEWLLDEAREPRPKWTAEELAYRLLGYTKRIKAAERRLR